VNKLYNLVLWWANSNIAESLIIASSLFEASNSNFKMKACQSWKNASDNYRLNIGTLRGVVHFYLSTMCGVLDHDYFDLLEKNQITVARKVGSKLQRLN
jgi:hypothetical protein